MAAAALAPSEFERLGFLMEALAAAAALRTATELGVLERLDKGPIAPGMLARDQGITERAAELLLAALAGVALVERTVEGDYAAASEMGAVARLVEHWSHLTEAVRDNRPVMRGDTPVGAERAYPEIVDALGAAFAKPAERVADNLARPGLRVIDIGAGAAPWGLALAGRYSDCEVTAVDLPAVLNNTRRAVRAAGLETQFRYVAGDFFSVDFGHSSHDLAVAGNICHLFDESANRKLLARLFETLRPGGCVALIDEVPNERMDGPRGVVLYALGLLLRSGSGRAYPFTTYSGWLIDAGFEAVSRTEIDSTGLVSLITARRPD